MTVLEASKAFAPEELNVVNITKSEAGVDMFRPYQRRIGVLARDQAMYSLVDLEGVTDNHDAKE